MNRFNAPPLILILGDMLHDGLPDLPSDAPVFMAEDLGLATHVRHHRQKLVLVFSAMRHFRDRLRDQDRDVTYHEIQEGVSILRELVVAAGRRGAREVVTYEVNDRFFRDALQAACHEAGLTLRQVPSPMFLTPWCEWDRYVRTAERLRMGDFYVRQRRRLGLLLNPRGQPMGGVWSLDRENRRALPSSLDVPEPWYVEPDALTREVIGAVDRNFPDHPGRATDFWLPVTHEEAIEWLEAFVETRLDKFGPYQDAIPLRSRMAFHSGLSPFLNVGLLNPREVLEAVFRRHARRAVPLNSLEGFVRQLVGWREFLRGVDREYGRLGIGPEGEGTGAGRRLRSCWYDATTGLPPLDLAIARARDHAWCHHIERLMILGAAMLMTEIAPAESYRWFMEMFLDSADWVMLPNVIGMSAFADGGRIATKPYLSGSAYLRRMGDFPPGEWCDVWDGLFWRYLAQHRETFAANPRTGAMLENLDALEPARRERLFALADTFTNRTTAVP